MFSSVANRLSLSEEEAENVICKMSGSGVSRFAIILTQLSDGCLVGGMPFDLSYSEFCFIGFRHVRFTCFPKGKLADPLQPHPLLAIATSLELGTIMAECQGGSSRVGNCSIDKIAN